MRFAVALVPFLFGFATANHHPLIQVFNTDPFRPSFHRVSKANDKTIEDIIDPPHPVLPVYQFGANCKRDCHAIAFETVIVRGTIREWLPWPHSTRCHVFSDSVCNPINEILDTQDVWDQLQFNVPGARSVRCLFDCRHHDRVRQGRKRKGEKERQRKEKDYKEMEEIQKNEKEKKEKEKEGREKEETETETNQESQETETIDEESDKKEQHYEKGGNIPETITITATAAAASPTVGTAKRKEEEEVRTERKRKHKHHKDRPEKLKERRAFMQFGDVLDTTYHAFDRP